MADIIRKDQLEAKIKEEKELIRKGELREENPLDTSREFSDFLEACRKGNLRKCQEMINDGININAKDEFDYTPLVLVGFLLRLTSL
jgi:ankyrin repeat/BTB/POZ domain-containing protein 1